MVITCDESWVYGYDPETKGAVLTMETPIIIEAKGSTTGLQQRQGFVDCFFYSRGVVHHDYAPQGQTVTKEYYEGVLCRLHNAVLCK
jgi:hypothetical protein